MNARGSGQATGYETYTDVAVVAMVSEGDGDALEALYDRHGRQAYALARHILDDDRLAWDVVREVFLSVWRDPSRFDDRRGGFASWLLAVTHREAVDMVRREENQRRRRSGAQVIEWQEATEPRVEDSQAARSEAVLDPEPTLRGERARRALEELPEPQREVVVLAYFGGYTQREIAGLIGVPLETVKARMLAGVRGMRQSLSTQREGR